MQPKYKLYATNLDAFRYYLNSEEDNRFQELIDRINRVPFDSEKVDRGTAFNEVIDCMIDGRKSDKVEIHKVFDSLNVCIALKATYNSREFFFPLPLCREFADYFKGALTQQRVEAILPTRYGDVLVYGVIDELLPASVHDIKTTEKYYVGKFRHNFQHLVYPYCLMQNGSDVRTFEYNIVEFGEDGVNTSTETYVFNPERDIPILKNHCEEFIEFIEEHKSLITDKKIFGEE